MKVLIANRGEIAIRVFRTAREMGIRTIAVVSDADRHALHPQFADVVVELGGSEPRECYLNSAKIIAAAQEHGPRPVP